MANSEAEIGNSALIKLGAEGRILSLEDNSREARIIKEQFFKIRDALFRAHPWNFTIKRVGLAALPTAPEWGFSKQFQVPTDCLRILETDVPEAEWQKEGNVLVTDASDINIRYISKITEVAKWDTCFCESFACRLAHDICYAITQSNTLKDELFKEYRYWIGEARSFDGQEGGTRQVYANQWLNARY